MTVPLIYAGLLATAVQAGPDRVMLGFDGPADRPAIEARLQALGGRVERCFERARFCAVHLPVPQRPQLSELAAWPGVRYAEEDRLMEGVVHPSATPPPPPPPGDAEGTDDCPDQWELATIGAFEAWELVDGSWAPVVAIQDSGFLTTHEELEGRISGQYDYGNGDAVAEVEWSAGVPAHGTFIAGVVSGHPENGAGRAGVAPYGQVNLQKIADSDGALYYSYATWAMGDIAEGDLGVRVLSYSIASSSYTSSFHDAVSALADANILLVTAAGNCSSAHCSDADNDANPMYPGSFGDEHIVTVASSTREDGFNSYSHYGASSVDLAAPGEDICSCGVYSDDDYYSSGGTSYATPLVAASAALLLEAHPALSTTELARILRASAQDLPAWEGKVRSDGRLDLAGALHTAVPRFDAPADAVVDGEASVLLDVDNAAWEGEAWVVLAHDDALDVVRARDQAGDVNWTLERHLEGDTVEMPDAGSLTLEGTRLTVLRGSIPAHASAALELTVRGRELGNHDVSARVVMSSEGADYLNAPYSDGQLDPTGFLAWNFQLRVTSLSEDTGWEDTARPGDTQPPEDSDPAQDDTGGEKPGACGCAAAPAASGFWLVAALLAALRRRGC